MKYKTDLFRLSLEREVWKGRRKGEKGVPKTSRRRTAISFLVAVVVVVFVVAFVFIHPSIMDYRSFVQRTAGDAERVCCGGEVDWGPGFGAVWHCGLRFAIKVSVVRVSRIL